ncbi:MAG: 23S rRNA (pseudouridine(1915)-N(3))-methyltransferase RlmH [Oscillospiraceae bacterium]|jgi:23S rRNA (pseudouridine1915-N3)-methyltransferase|nr:23S rRNA (pseudouridine(1915)-N(3))-methyltransferase RlmH [Oscillospiraceae bacterium]
MNYICVICVGRLKDRFFEEASAEYEKRLKAFCRLEIVTVSPAALPENPNAAQIHTALEKEADAIIKKIPPAARVYPLCIEGKRLSSEAFAQDLRQAALQGASSAVFVIGGSHGLSERVKALGVVRLSMSEMTFPHRLARIMLLEQIYRAFSINAGSKYHK